MSNVRVAVAGVGNCANCLIQGAEYLAQNNDPVPDFTGLLTQDVCGLGPGSVEVSLGFDVDPRKVGRDLNEAMWAEPNVAEEFFVPDEGVEFGPVLAGPLNDGLGRSHSEKVHVPGGNELGKRFALTQQGVASALREHEIDVLVNFLPVGAEVDSRLYAWAALEAKVAFVNAIPVRIAGDDQLRGAFARAGVPLIGDDVKSQVGATILHRALAEAFVSRGAKIEKTYQLNHGGNTDFWNMKDEERLQTKRASKTGAVRSVADIDEGAVHIGPSGFVGFLRDEKVAYIRVEGRGFLGNALQIEARYSGQDSPNSAAVVYDAVRFAAAASRFSEDVPREMITVPASAWLMKSPPIPLSDSEAYDRCRVLAETRPCSLREMNGDSWLAAEVERELRV